MFTPYGPLTRESYLSCCPFGTSQGTSQTNQHKHNHFKQIEAESPETLIENRKPIKKVLGFFHNEDILAPHESLTR